MSIEFNYKKIQLIQYMNLYISKRKFFMNPVFMGIVKQLQNDFFISENQFHSVIKFLEREPKFKKMERDEIQDYFQILIGNKKHQYLPWKEQNTLEEFFK